MLNIVVPMAGAGSRFANKGYLEPKPLIPINGIPMINLVIHNLRPPTPHKFIFICQVNHIQAYGLEEHLNACAPGCEIIGLKGITEGAACTVLAAERYINNDAPLMIANSDQFIDVEIIKYLVAMNHYELDGLIMTMKANDPKWSYVKIDDHDLVTHVVEKKVISDEATVGIYNFRRGRYFVEGAKSMITMNLRVNNEFYVAPVYNQLIAKGMKIGYYNIGKELDGMYGLGTPEDLELFKSLPVCSKVMRCIQ